MAKKDSRLKYPTVLSLSMIDSVYIVNSLGGSKKDPVSSIIRDGNHVRINGRFRFEIWKNADSTINTPATGTGEYKSLTVSKEESLDWDIYETCFVNKDEAIDFAKKRLSYTSDSISNLK